MAQSQSWRTNVTPLNLRTQAPATDDPDAMCAWFTDVYRFASINREESIKEASWMAIKQIERLEKRLEFKTVLLSMLASLDNVYNTEDPDHPYTPLDPDDPYPTPTPPTPPNN